MSSLFSFSSPSAAPVLITPGSTVHPTQSLPDSLPFIPTSKPISLLSTPLARTFEHLHPILLASIFYLKFSALVENPVTALRDLLVPVAALQVAYTSICLLVHAGRSAAGQGQESTKSNIKGKVPTVRSRPTPWKRPYQVSAGPNASAASRIAVCVNAHSGGFLY